MSVLVLAPQCMEYIHAGLVKAAYRSSCDIYFSSSIREYFKDYDIEQESERLVKSWQELNILSFCVAYNEMGANKADTINFRQTHQVNIYQLLKYITCLIYNIELNTIKRKQSYSQGEVANVPALTEFHQEDYALLKAWREDIQAAIIGNIMDYELAHWSDIPGTKREIRGYDEQLMKENKTIVVKQLTTPLQ